MSAKEPQSVPDGSKPEPPPAPPSICDCDHEGCITAGDLTKIEVFSDEDLEIILTRIGVTGVQKEQTKIALRGIELAAWHAGKANALSFFREIMDAKRRSDENTDSKD